MASVIANAFTLPGVAEVSNLTQQINSVQMKIKGFLALKNNLSQRLSNQNQNNPGADVSQNSTMQFYDNRIKQLEQESEKLQQQLQQADQKLKTDRQRASQANGQDGPFGNAYSGR